MIPTFFKRHKAETILALDALIFWASLVLVLVLRYGRAQFHGEWSVHAGPFFVLMIVWLLVMYVADLYSYPRWNATLENAKTFIAATAINFALSIGIFYIFGSFFKLTPKFNLAAFTVLFLVIDGAFRYAVARLLASRGHRTEVIFLSSSPLAIFLEKHIQKHPQLGYALRTVASADEAVMRMKEDSKKIIVVDSAFLKEDARTGTLFSLRSEHSEIETLAGFHERLLGRVPLEEIGDEWVVREIASDIGIYAVLKRALDLALSFVLVVILSPFFLIIAVMVASSSEGMIIYRQTRVGKDGEIFTLYKFRTMRTDAEKDGPAWSTSHDPRATGVGRFLRHTHLDELPQLWNILTGDMSFVGPRPERPEFTATLAPSIPYYRLRETILPGLTGWAQIKFRYANTPIEAREKFEYDLYYLKNKNFVLDLGIIAQTLRYVFKGQGLKKTA